MKQITISHYGNKRKDTLVTDFKKYQIFIDSDTWKHFTNKKEAEKFLAEQSRLFSIMLDEIIHLNSLIYTEVWKYWYEVDSSGKMLFESFRFVENLINNMIARSNTNNGDSIYHIRNNFNKVINELHNVINEIITERQKANKHGNNRLLKVYRRNLNDLANKLESREEKNK